MELGGFSGAIRVDVDGEAVTRIAVGMADRALGRRGSSARAGGREPEAVNNRIEADR